LLMLFFLTPAIRVQCQRDPFRLVFLAYSILVSLDSSGRKHTLVIGSLDYRHIIDLELGSIIGVAFLSIVQIASVRRILVVSFILKCLVVLLLLMF
jgi:hypothetical protein